MVQFNIASLAAGTYTLVAKSEYDDEVITKQFVKQ
jgi:hypothetical protein